MRVLVPFDADRPKTRLAEVLDGAERRAFARAMLRDVLAAVRGAGEDPDVLATAPVEWAGEPPDAPVTVDDRPLTAAVNAALDDAGRPLGVVMADLPLLTPAGVERARAATGDVVVAAGRGGGTNALVVRHPDFRVDYHGASYLDHLRAARSAGASVRELDSRRFATDVDEPADLVEVLVHGDGAAVEWLRDAGFRLDAGDGRVDVVRARG
ncbi:MAG: 2-phospho-L-lactate guanylyltransferase [Haloferacaceae archaeon]